MRPFGAVFTIALALAADGALTAMQQPPPARSQVIIGSRTGARMPPPPRPMTRPAGGTFHMEAALDDTQMPSSLPASAKGVFVLARDLVLGDQRLAVQSPLVIILAESLKVSGNAVIDISARQPGVPGGQVMLLARTITCDGAGRLEIIANGGAPSAPGGSLTITGAGAQPPCITHRAAGGPGGVAQVRDHRGRGAPRLSARRLPGGAAGTVHVHRNIESARANNPAAAEAASAWMLARLDYLRLTIYAAASGGDDGKVLALFREYESLAAGVALVAPAARPQYLEIVKDLNTYRTTALAPLFVEDVTVSPGGLPRVVTVFTEGSNLESTLAPTHALAVRAGGGGRSALGVIDYRNDRPDEIAIEIEWELTVDPWIAKLAAAELRNGAKLRGVFSGWGLEAKPMQEIGVRSATATLLPGGRRLRARFVADAASANLVFWRLLNTSGLPWTVDWTYREPRTNRVVTGTWAGPPLSVARQRAPQLEVSGGRIRNGGTSAATVHYVRTGDDAFVPLNPPVLIAPGGSVAPAGVSGGFSVPAEAVEIAFDPERFAADFHVLNGEEIVDQVVIRNLLPATDEQRGAFDYVEITVTSAMPGGEGVAGGGDAIGGGASIGPLRLSATGTRGAEITLPMLRLTRGARQVTIAGKAYYAGGGERTLVRRTFDTLTIAITPEMFQQPPAHLTSK